MAALHPRLRKQLSAPGLLQSIRRSFEKVPEHRNERSEIPLPDALMSGLAVFGLKYPSLLKFDEAYNEGVIRHNPKTLYEVERAPCDTQLRTILDPVDPAHLRPAFRAVHRQLQRHKALEPYRYLDGYYLVSVDGTGQFASGEISCPECCIKTVQGQTHYYHQLLGAVMVHPDLKTVLPLAPEAITRQDGTNRNDCERAAAKRLLTQLRNDYPQLKCLVVEDSLSANGPHLELLRSLNLCYLINVKEGDHEALFAAVQEKLATGECQEWEYTDAQGVEHGYRWVNDLPLNKTHPHIRVNFLEYWEIDGDQQRLFSWITDIELTPDNVEPLMRGGRARWKVENETFNTLKNLGYELEHNYGHGCQHLATVFALLMMLAFLVDQAQELGCRLFQAARAYFRSRTSLWERLRALFTGYYIPDWKDPLGGHRQRPCVQRAGAGYLLANLISACSYAQVLERYPSKTHRLFPSLQQKRQGGAARWFLHGLSNTVITTQLLRAGIAATLSMLLLCNSTLAMGKEVTGMIRKYSDFIIFWPCSSLLPHYVIMDPSAETNMATYFFETQSLYITVDAEITNEQTRGQDGTIIIYRILDSGENIRGCQIPMD